MKRFMAPAFALALLLMLPVIPAQAAVLASDNCTRANNADLGTAWDPAITTFKIAGNLCVANADATDSVERNNTVSWPNDQYAKSTLSTAPTTAAGTGYGAGCRWDNASTTGYWGVGSTQGYEVASWKSGTFASIQKTGDGGAAATTFANGDTFEIRCTGSSPVTIVLVKNGSIFTTVTDSVSPIASGFAAIAHASTTSSGSISAWEGGDFSSTTSSSRMLMGVGQ